MSAYFPGSREPISSSRNIWCALQDGVGAERGAHVDRFVPPERILVVDAESGLSRDRARSARRKGVTPKSEAPAHRMFLAAKVLNGFNLFERAGPKFPE
jgi:hypothetical protein